MGAWGGWKERHVAGEGGTNYEKQREVGDIFGTDGSTSLIQTCPLDI